MSGSNSDFFKTFGNLPIAGFCLSPEVQELLAPIFDKGAREAGSTDGCTNSRVFGPPRPPPPPFDYYFPEEITAKRVKGRSCGKDSKSVKKAQSKRKLSGSTDGSDDGGSVDKKQRCEDVEGDAGSEEGEKEKPKCVLTDGDKL